MLLFKIQLSNMPITLNLFHSLPFHAQFQKYLVTSNARSRIWQLFFYACPYLFNMSRLILIIIEQWSMKKTAAILISKLQITTCSHFKLLIQTATLHTILTISVSGKIYLLLLLDSGIWTIVGEVSREYSLYMGTCYTWC